LIRDVTEAIMPKPTRILCLLATLATVVLAQAPAPVRPKLVVAIMVDQFRYDYLHRFRSSYSGGLARLLEHGAVFTDAHYIHVPTLTAVGHATFLTGALPRVTGIVDNEWYQRERGRKASSVDDPDARLLGAEGDAASPYRLPVSTVGDELKLSGSTGSKVIGVALKDRSAILPAGRMGDGAYWFDPTVGSFVSSTWYFDDLPAWVNEFNFARPADGFAGKSWARIDGPAEAPLRVMPAERDKKLYDAVQRTPFGNDLLIAFTERAVEAEKLGQRGVMDILTISFSANDYVGHDFGPHSPQARDMCIRTDRVLGRFFEYLDKRVGRGEYLVVFTADHGGSPVPEEMQKRKMHAGRLQPKDMWGRVTKALTDAFGPGQWVLGDATMGPYLNHELMREKKAEPARARAIAAEALESLPGVYRVYTREQVVGGLSAADPVESRVLNGYHLGQSPDLIVVPEPYWLIGTLVAHHFSPWHYDTHVPLIFHGPGIEPGRYHRPAAVNDIAPTLALMLGIEPPSASAGRILAEMLP
jgi:predicted AlkP superfamily pyrophosphatase or phosphodiesterase